MKTLSHMWRAVVFGERPTHTHLHIYIYSEGNHLLDAVARVHHHLTSPWLAAAAPTGDFIYQKEKEKISKRRI